jgi:hypothetical protein
VNEPSTTDPLREAVSGKGVQAVRDLARLLRRAFRVPPAPDALGWLLLAGALAAFLPFLLERIRGAAEIRVKMPHRS